MLEIQELKNEKRLEQLDPQERIKEEQKTNPGKDRAKSKTLSTDESKHRLSTSDKTQINKLENKTFNLNLNKA